MTDNKQGKLVATRAITKGNEAKDAIVFTNTYEPTSSPRMLQARWAARRSCKRATATATSSRPATSASS